MCHLCCRLHQAFTTALGSCHLCERSPSFMMLADTLDWQAVETWSSGAARWLRQSWTLINNMLLPLCSLFAMSSSRRSVRYVPGQGFWLIFMHGSWTKPLAPYLILAQGCIWRQLSYMIPWQIINIFINHEQEQALTAGNQQATRRLLLLASYTNEVWKSSTSFR